MRFSPDAAYRLLPSELRAFSQVEGWRTLLHVACEWSSIVAAAWLCARFWHPVTYLLAVIWIGARLHALGLLAHDGAHFLLLQNRRWNDLVCELFCAWPIFMSLPTYRKIHMRHHSHLNTSEDPDWARNRPDRLRERRGTLALARILLGLSSEQRELARFFTTRETTGEATSAARRYWLRIFYYGAFAVGFALAGGLHLLVLYWLVPLFTWFLFAMRLKGIGEHFAVEDRTAANAARTTYLSWPERIFIAPKNVEYHVEHHLYPSVPFHRLPALHQRLLQSPAYRESVHVTNGYLGMLAECARAGRDAPEVAR